MPQQHNNKKQKNILFFFLKAREDSLKVSRIFANMNVDLEVVSSPVAGTMSDLPVYLMLQIVPDSQYICVGVIEIKLHHSTVLALILKRESHNMKNYYWKISYL